MGARPSGRLTESLFDNRYRYDTIYPRGRSGETLRAYDTQDQDRPVVIKRPAPQDAPPMRAGQEVSIRIEKQALERLSGHPVLTELRGSGVFRVGGHTHEYIVMDFALGQTVEEMVLERAERGEYLSELEALVVIDHLLDLLALAHDKRIIYNDVDAKHLFWDRDQYRLKVIDWGNAVFLDEPGALSNISRSTDIYQCGELIYFVLTGGKRLAVEEEGDTFFVNFGVDAERISAKLQSIVTRAVNPDPKRRYGSIVELKNALSEYRQPLEKARDDILSRVRKRVRATASQNELEELAEALRAAQDMDPGYPETNALAAQIRSYLKQITIQADLDAIRIYLESGNWPRASSLLGDLLPTADNNSRPLIEFLISATGTLEEMRIAPPPAGFLAALDPLFQGDVSAAGQILLTTNENRNAARQAQWLLAEQLSRTVAEVTLLRPHLARLRHELGEDNALLDDIDKLLAQPPQPGLTALQVRYEDVGALLEQLETESSADEALLSTVIYAQRAIRAVTENLGQVGEYVIRDPGRAGELLHQAHQVDPTSPLFDTLHDYFDEVHQALAALGQFKPKADGTNLAMWFADVQEFLRPYLDDLSDAQLHATAAALDRAAQGWNTVISYLALGRRQPTIDMLRSTADILRTFNENLAAWLGNLATRLADAAQVERHSPNTRLADSLTEGWKAWDQGRGALAAEIGQKAREHARTEGERLAADRLRKLGELLERWLVDDGVTDIERTDQAETETLSTLLSDEDQERRTFAEQMPNTTLYLRAMSRGIVAYMQQSSSAGWRALYLHYVLRGMLSLLNNDLEEAEFWRNAASRTFDDARTHRAFQVLDRMLTGRRLVEAAEKAMNAVTGPKDLENVRQTLNAPLAAEWLAGAEQAVYDTNQALHNWADGEFYNARQQLDSALVHMQQAVDKSGLKVEPFVTWLTRLRDAAADLQQQRLVLEKSALSTSEEPDPALTGVHRRIVSLTQQTLGSDYVHQVRQWEEMYTAVLETYSTQRLSRREKLAAFSRHFASLFITKHPLYPLFRHWESVIEQLPPDEAEDDVIEMEAVEEDSSAASVSYLEDDQELETAPRRERTGGLPWNWIIIGSLVLLVAVVGFAVIRSSGENSDNNQHPTAREPELVPPATQFPTRTTRPEPSNTPVTPATAAVAVVPATDAPTNTPFVIPTNVPTTEVPTEAPTNTPEPTIEASSATPVVVYTPTLQPLDPGDTPATFAPAGSEPNHDALAALAAMPVDLLGWSADEFQAGDNDTWRITSGSANSITIELTPDLINALFMPGTANTIAKVEAVMQLVEYDPEALANGEIAFGLGAQNMHDQQAMGEVKFEPDLLNLGLNQNNQFSSKTRVPQSDPTVEITLSLQRFDANTLAFYVNDKLLGNPVIVFPQNEPLTLLLFVTGQNVVVEVTSLQIDYRPGADLP